jgi:tRNA dimethylallyltransferase
MNFDQKDKVLYIIGPTGVGKTRVAIEIAQRFNAEIISTDSRLLYLGMDIGTAKPSKGERGMVRHHLIDVTTPDVTWSLAQFTQAITDSIRIVIGRGKLPILVGGTGQYFRSFVEGWDIPAVKPDNDLRQAIENWGNAIGAFQLHEKMRILDPEAGKIIQPQNIRRTIRALEVIFSTGKRFSELRTKSTPEFDCKVIGLSRNREELYQIIDDRIESMFESGFVEEVQRLVDAGYSKFLPSMSAIGYNEVMQYLAGEITLDETKRMMRQKTRQFIRRQANWFKRDSTRIEWHEMIPDPVDSIATSVSIWLNGG